MKQLPIKTTIGLFAQVAAVILIYFHQPLASQLLALAGLTLASQDIPKFSSWLQYSLTWTGSIILGQSIEFGSGNFPLITIALFIWANAVLLRAAFYTFFVHTRFIWLDPTLLAIANLLYIVGNMYYHYSWQGWTFPLPPFIFGGFLISGFVKEGLSYKKDSDKGYKAEVGKPAPDFTLPDQDGKQISLSEFKNKRHVLVLFVRGDWCPACHMMLRAYERGKEKFQQKNVFLIAIGPDPSGTNKAMAERIGIDFCILSDESHNVTSSYGVYTEKDPVQNPIRRNPNDGLPLPASFLICDKGIVRHHSSPERVGEFLDPTLVFDVLKRL